MGATKRGKGTKWMVVVDGQGLPLASQLTSVSPAAVTLAEAIRDSIQAEGQPEPVIADKAYDSDPFRQALAERGLELICPHCANRTRSKTQDGRKLRRYRRPWNIERTFAWLGNFPTLVVRYERHILMYSASFHLLTQPVGRLPKHAIISYHDFRYRAGSWERPRRVVAKVEWYQGEIFPRVGFVVTNMRAQPQPVVRFYNGRGTAEGWIKQGKYALHWTRLSCHRFRANQVRLALFVLAYNLGNFVRRLALPPAVRDWSLCSLQAKLIKIGAKVVTHSRRIIFQMAEVAVPKMLFETILKRTGELTPTAT